MSTVKPIPDGFHTVTPYLVVNDADRLLAFLTQAFEARPGEIARQPDGKIMHAQVTVGDSPVMFAEATEQWPAMPAAFYLYVLDTDATYRRGLEAGATSLMEPADQFYGDRNAGLRDPVGNSWWIATHVEDVSPEEMERRMQARTR
jgi:PhnB protein